MDWKPPRDVDQNIELDNVENSGMIGQAGRDLFQIGQAYIRLIYNNSRSGNWGVVVIALIPLFLFLFGIKAGADKVVETFGIKPSTADSATTPKPATSSSANPSPISQSSTQIDASQSNEFQFPKESCGDKSTDANNTWYPVFINGGNLDEVQQKYCKDAINATRKTGEKAIQVASFISDTKALKFAKAVGGEVGEPRRPSSLTVQPSKAPETQPPATTPQNNPSATEQRAAEQRAAEQRAAEQRAAEQRAAEQRAAEQRAAEQRAAEQRAAEQRAAEQRAAEQRAAEQRAAIRQTTCIVTVGNPSVVSLMNRPDTFSQQIIRVDPGDYTSLEHRVVDRGFLGQEGWFKIEARGRVGWIKDDTFTISDKTRVCP
jgi:hypothetical protein